MAAANLQTRPSDDCFPIRTVSAITGVNAVTLRAWERRYGLVKPQRTAKGHRLYSHGDIERINQIVRLLERGVSVGQAAAHLAASAPAASTNPEDPWQGYIQRAIDYITTFQEQHLDQLYNQALALYPIEVVTNRFIVPVLVLLGERWESNAGTVAEEHFFGTFIRNKLGARFHHRHVQRHGRRLLVSCLEGEHHEIGAMLFALAANDNGYQIIYLGPNMPMGELALAARRAHCDAIVISGSIDPSLETLNQHLRELVRTATCPVFMGGLTSINWQDAIRQAGAIALGSDIKTSLGKLETTLDALE